MDNRKEPTFQHQAARAWYLRTPKWAIAQALREALAGQLTHTKGDPTDDTSEHGWFPVARHLTDHHQREGPS